ncbi:hypothetical protein BSG1_13516 [Bacillus sp. SG-1]|nr:hypothetical protein BSG1_13516 [Bacillus sp. SG-1]
MMDEKFTLAAVFISVKEMMIMDQSFQ